MKFSKFAEYLEKLEKTTKRLEMFEILSQLFKEADIAIVNKTPVLDLSEILDDTWEERAQFTLNVSVIGTDEDIVKSILAVDIESEFQSRGISYQQTIEVQ